MLNTYKVYAIKQRLNGAIVYIGLTRVTLYKRFSNHVSKRKWKRDEYFIELIQENLTLQEGVILEEMLINQYQTRVNGFNKAPMAINGYSNKQSDEQRKLSSERLKGKPFKGRQNRTSPNTPEHNRKISEANARPVICLNDGKIYKSQRQAALKLGLGESKVSLVLSGKRPHTKGYRFKYLTPVNSL